MTLSVKQIKIIRLSARVLSAAVILIGLPFYFGYGNPLPFLNPDYTLWDNTWLTIFPLMFTGLALGWRFEKTGGWMIVFPVTVGLILGIVMHKEIILHMLIPLIAGILHLVTGYNLKK
jgi:hypothetical protein